MSPVARSRFLLIAAVPLLLTACTWVKVSPEAQEVVVVPGNRVTGCQRIGVVSSSVKATIMAISRDSTKVRNELDDLARGQAVAIGANTLVRESINEGKGRYVAYKCP